MRYLRVVASLWISAGLALTSLAQTASSQAAPYATGKSKGNTASERTFPADPCVSPGSNGMFCEVAQRRFGPPMPPRMRRPVGSYPGYPRRSMWMGESHPGHAAIGALLLGGLGATLAANTHPNGQKGPNVVGALFVGGLGAVVGGFIGNSIPWSHSRGYQRRSGPDEDELASGKDGKQSQQPEFVKSVLPPQLANPSTSGSSPAPAP